MVDTGFLKYLFNCVFDIVCLKWMVSLQVQCFSVLDVRENVLPKVKHRINLFMAAT